MGLKLITEPAVLAVSLDEAIAHLRVDETEETAESALIELYLKAAIAFVDGAGAFLGRALVDQTWELSLDEFPSGAIDIPLPPLLEVVSVKYDDADGEEQTVAAEDFTVSGVGEAGKITPAATWPTTTAARVRFRAGYVDLNGSPAIGEVPSDIKAAILLHVGSLYENRGDASASMPATAEALLRRKRFDLSLA